MCLRSTGRRAQRQSITPWTRLTKYSALPTRYGGKENSIEILRMPQKQEYPYGRGVLRRDFVYSRLSICAWSSLKPHCFLLLQRGRRSQVREFSSQYDRRGGPDRSRHQRKVPKWLCAVDVSVCLYR